MALSEGFFNEESSGFPASSPTIISTFKLNIGLSWVGVIVGEFLVSVKKIGYTIIYGFPVFNFTLVLLSLLLIAVFAAIMYQFLSFAEKTFKRLETKECPGIKQ